MKTIFYLLVLLFFSIDIFAQQLLTQNKYIIYLNDKNSNQFTLNDSAQFLSGRALQRRVSQNIHIVNNDLPVTQNYKNAIANTGAKILQTSRWLNYVCVQIADSMQLASIMQLPFVTSNKLVNRPYTISLNNNVTDKLLEEKSLNSSSLLRNSNTSQSSAIQTNAINYGASFNQINQIGGDALHNLNYLGQGVQIAVFDAGFPNVDTLHAFDSLRFNNRLLGHYNFVNDTTDVFNSAYNGHGCNTLSCMAAWHEGQLVGTAPRASYYLFITENAASETPYEEVCWVAAAELSDSLGVDIISSSLGYTSFNDANESYSNANMNGNTAICTKGADIAASKGMLVINSAGNEGSSTWQIISAPADGDSVLSVGSVNATGNHSSFSSKGPSADGRVKPDVCAQGEGSIIAKQTGGFQGANGTSFSCPILAGMAACLWQAFPGSSNLQISQAIKESASIYNTPNNLLGYGIPNFSNALFLITKTKFSAIANTQISNVFPLPFSNHINVIYHSLDTENITINIVDVFGKLLYNKLFWATTNAQNIFACDGLENLSSGVYFLNVKSGSQIFTSKIVKLQ